MGRNDTKSAGTWGRYIGDRPRGVSHSHLPRKATLSPIPVLNSACTVVEKVVVAD